MYGRRPPLSGWSEEVMYKQRQAWKGRKSMIQAAGAPRENVLRLMGRKEVTGVQEEEEGQWARTDGREGLGRDEPKCSVHSRHVLALRVGSPDAMCTQTLHTP